MFARLSLVVAVVFVSAAALAHAQAPQTVNVGLGDDFFAPEAVTIALNGTVKFAYDAGDESHNVHFEQGGAACTQTSGAASGPVSGRAVPVLPEGPGWTADCQFPTAGTYTFFCDYHLEMRGQITVLNADGTTPTPTPTATPTPTVPPGTTPTPGTGGGQPGATPTPGGDTTPTTARIKSTVRASQRGTAVTGTLAAGSARTRVTVEALARRADLRASGKAKLVRVGRTTRTVAANGRARFSVALNARARSALRRLGRLRLTVRITAGGRTESRTVTLRRPAK